MYTWLSFNKHIIIIIEKKLDKRQGTVANHITENIPVIKICCVSIIKLATNIHFVITGKIILPV